MMTVAVNTDQKLYEHGDETIFTKAALSAIGGVTI